MHPIKEEGVRTQRMESFREAGINLYPSKSTRTHTVDEAAKAAQGIFVCVTGRLISKREIGKLCFGHLKDQSGKIQLAFSAKELGTDSYSFFTKNFDVGDFIEAQGEIFTTHKGEISVMVKKYILLAKALLPLPEKFHGLTDTEIRYRQRYLDLLANDGSMNVAKLRSLLVKELRRYFDKLGFFEVETPILQPLYGGANAAPFVTHHNALDIPLYLRIAPELYLKRLIVGGFEKVYEIARCFRNEGIDNNHNPEFTQIEFYWAYADYNDLMDLVEDLIPYLLESLGLPIKFTTAGNEVDFTPPYPRKTMRGLLKQYADMDMEDYDTDAKLFKKAKELKVENIDSASGWGKILDEIYKMYVRPKIINPIFMIDHPAKLSPLAKRKTDEPDYVERAQLLCAGGNELCNGWSELNDPIDQENRFKEQERQFAKGDAESMRYDSDYVTALKYGMPPTAGLGIGIDRLVKLFVNTDNLKEAILFPTLKPQK